MSAPYGQLRLRDGAVGGYGLAPRTWASQSLWEKDLSGCWKYVEGSWSPLSLTCTLRIWQVQAGEPQPPR